MMFYIADFPGQPVVLAELPLTKKLDVSNAIISAALTDLSAHEATSHVQISYDLKREDPWLVILSCFAYLTPDEQMLDMATQSLSGLQPVLKSEPRIRVVYLNLSNGMCDDFDGARRQDLYTIGGDHNVVGTDLLVWTDGFIDASTMLRRNSCTGSWSDDELDIHCSLYNVTNGLTPIRPDDTRTLSVLFEYDNDYDRENYIDPSKESWDINGKSSRYQNDWVDFLPGLKEKGAKIQELNLSFQPWPPLESEIA